AAAAGQGGRGVAVVARGDQTPGGGAAGGAHRQHQQEADRGGQMPAPPQQPHNPGDPPVICGKCLKKPRPDIYIRFMAGQASSWFRGAGFGMFVHWDHASQQGLELSWPMVGGVFALPKCQAVPVAQYHSSAATFDPRRWDAPALARHARDAGMRYGVLTAKHHSGYAMFHTAVSAFSVEHSPFGRDIVGEFVDASRSEGLRVALYYSRPAWSH